MSGGRPGRSAVEPGTTRTARSSRAVMYSVRHPVLAIEPADEGRRPLGASFASQVPGASRQSELPRYTNASGGVRPYGGPARSYEKTCVEEVGAGVMLWTWEGCRTQ
jgi:hypothetical protein